MSQKGLSVEEIDQIEGYIGAMFDGELTLNEADARRLIAQARLSATPPLPVEDGELVREAISALRYAYGNVSSVTADKVKGSIIPGLDRLVSRIEDGGLGTSKPITPGRAEVSPSPEGGVSGDFLNTSPERVNETAPRLTRLRAALESIYGIEAFGDDKHGLADALADARVTAQRAIEADDASGATCLPQALSAEGDSLCTAEPAAAEASCPADICSPLEGK